jgi:hypothetical protein
VADRNANGFIQLNKSMLNTPAWEHLSPHACKLLLAIRQRHTGMNNGAIPYSIKEAKQLLRCGSDRARACFDELVDKGFIKVARDSSFDLKTRLSREWTITAERLGDQEPTAEFTEWEFTDE